MYCVLLIPISVREEIFTDCSIEFSRNKPMSKIQPAHQVEKHHPEGEKVRRTLLLYKEKTVTYTSLMSVGTSGEYKLLLPTPDERVLLLGDGSYQRFWGRPEDDTRDQGRFPISQDFWGGWKGGSGNRVAREGLSSSSCSPPLRSVDWRGRV